MGLGFAVGPIIGGTLADAVSLRWAYVAGAIIDYRKLLDEHDITVRAVRAVVAEGAPVVLPTNSPYPDGWWLAAAARVLVDFPEAVVDWPDYETV